MSLPEIEPYAPPPADQLPANRAGWSLEPARAVLVIHDMQRYFLRPYTWGAAPLADAVTNIATLRAACHAAGVPVVYTTKPGDMDARHRGLEVDFWGRGMRADPEQSGIVEPLEPGDGDVVVTKWRYSAFVDTDLAQRLFRWGRDQVLVTGVYAHIGCLLTATDAFMRDIQPFLVADAVADFSAEEHRLAVRYVAGRCGMALTTGQAMASLGLRRPAPLTHAGQSTAPKGHP